MAQRTAMQASNKTNRPPHKRAKIREVSMSQTGLEASRPLNYCPGVRDSIAIYFSARLPISQSKVPSLGSECQPSQALEVRLVSELDPLPTSRVHPSSVRNSTVWDLHVF